ncbi:MAG: hypothetical protein ACO3JL_21285, partial [Myxococcota bacterium]
MTGVLPPRYLSVLLLGLASPSLVACDLRAADAPPHTLAGGTSSSTKWQPAVVEGLLPCVATASWGELHEERVLRLFVGAGIDPKEAAVHLEAARVYWSKHGVSLRFDGVVRPLVSETFFAPALDDARVAAAGSGESRSEERHTLRDRLSHTLAPLRALLSLQHVPGETRAVNVVVTREIAPRGSPLGDLVDTLEGLAIPSHQA